MSRPKFCRTRLAAALAGATACGLAGQAIGSGFALIEQNVSGLGNAYAGQAAVAQDASTIFFNPAGLTRLTGPNVTSALHLIIPTSKFSDNGSRAALGQPLGNNGGDAGGLAPVPNLYASMPIGSNMAVGLGINAPFGLATEYTEGWIGRFQAMKSEVKTINVNPTLAYKVNDRISLGIGANYQRFEAELTNDVNYSAALASGFQSLAASGTIPAAAVPGLVASTAGLSSRAKIEGTDSAWGWNVGVLFSLDEATRIGVSYRSKIEYEVTGSAAFSNPAVPVLSGSLAGLNGAVGAVANTINQTRLFNGGVRLAVEMPDTWSVSLFRQLTPQIDLLADVSWTGWSSIPELRILRSDGNVLSVTPENFRDTWRVSAGANYRLNDRLTLKGGLAFDQSPVREAERTPRLPDNDRYWISGGGSYKLGPKTAIDFGLTYIFIKEPKINISGFPESVAANGQLSGKYDSNVLIISAQIAHTF